jgi:RNA polymerase sigma-70 factor (ECF subfamily)
MDAPEQQTTIDDIESAAWCADIAHRIGAGDASAEGQLASRLRPGLLMLLRRRCAYDNWLAADLCQDTLVIVLQRLRKRSMEDPARLAAFAAQTARQLAFDSRRRTALRKTDVDSSAIDSAQVAAQTDDSVEKASTTSLVRKLLDELPSDRDRELMRRFYLLEQSKEEICHAMVLAPGHFDQLIFRARGRLREMLQSRGTNSRDLLCVFIFWVPASWRN